MSPWVRPINLHSWKVTQEPKAFALRMAYSRCVDNRQRSDLVVFPPDPRIGAQPSWIRGFGRYGRTRVQDLAPSTTSRWSLATGTRWQVELPGIPQESSKSPIGAPLCCGVENPFSSACLPCYCFSPPYRHKVNQAWMLMHTVLCFELRLWDSASSPRAELVNR